MMPITIPRTIALLVVAILAALSEDVGPNHYWLSAAVLLWAPIMIWRDFHIKSTASEWSEVFLNLMFVVVVVNLVPQMWHIAAILGAMIVQSPATVAQPRGIRMYAATAGFFLAGMSVSGYLHNPPLWQITLGCMAGMYLPILLFAHWQATRHLRLQAKASTIDSMRLMAGGVAHDFNNYLTGVLGNAELARAELKMQERTSANRLTGQALDNVIVGADKARELARQLLSFSRATPHSQTMVDISVELQSLIDLLRGSAPESTTITYDNQDTAERSLVFGNPTTLQQLFMNLIINATESGSGDPDSTPEPRDPIRVEVCVTRLPATGKQTADLLRIAISDNGHGITKATRKKMFDPFVSTKIKGYGLGLAAAREIAQQHNGEIMVTSQVGKGTCITVQLPSPLSAEAAVSAGR